MVIVDADDRNPAIAIIAIPLNGPGSLVSLKGVGKCTRKDAALRYPNSP